MKSRYNKRNEKRRRSAFSHNNPLIFRDFSAIEDNSDAFRQIRKLANNAGRYAAAEAKARGIETAYVRGNELMKISAEGVAVRINPKITRTSFYIKYNPSTILYAVRK